MELSLRQVIEINNILGNIESDDSEQKSPEFAYNMSMILIGLEDHVKSWDKARQAAVKPTSGFLEYQEKHKALLLQYSTKDEEGKPICDTVDLGNGNTRTVYDIEDHEAFDPQVLSLNEEYADDIAYENSKSERVEALLNLLMSEAPKNITKGARMRVLLKNGILVKDEPKEAK
jgi:hypothetical protein